jgi:DNA ligase-1
LEGEVVAVDSETGDLQPFQTLSNRAKKNVEIGAITVNVCLFSFDLMYLNGEPLMDRPFRERRELLRSLFVGIPNRFTWVKSLDATSADSETVLEFFKGATDAKCEGIMVKVLDNTVKANANQEDPAPIINDLEAETPAPTSETNSTKPKEKNTRRKALLSTYEPDKRLESWLKVKKDYSTSSETLDLIPIAGWHGQGRKAKWWSPILLAVRNPESGALEAVTKCMSGFTDKFYQANKEKYAEGSPNVISRPAYVEYYGSPDVWFEPQEVWEMAFADITLSPTYTAAIGLVSEERGLSLRFPRFLKVREDKGIDEATSCDYLALLWRKQGEKAKVEGAEEELGWQDD